MRARDLRSVEAPCTVLRWRGPSVGPTLGRSARRGLVRRAAGLKLSCLLFHFDTAYRTGTRAILRAVATTFTGTLNLVRRFDFGTALVSSPWTGSGFGSWSTRRHTEYYILKDDGTYEMDKDSTRETPNSTRTVVWYVSIEIDVRPLESRSCNHTVVRG